MAERIVHKFPPGEFSRVQLVHDPLAGSDPQRVLCYQLVSRGMHNGGVVLCKMTRGDLGQLGEAIVKELLAK